MSINTQFTLLGIFTILIFIAIGFDAIPAAIEQETANQHAIAHVHRVGYGEYREFTKNN